MTLSATDVAQFENGTRSDKPGQEPAKLERSYGEIKGATGWNIFSNILTIVGVVVLCALVAGYPLSSIFTWGYYLLSVRGLLGLFYRKGWLSRFRVKDKRRLDWYLQIFSSGLLATGMIYKILTDDVQWQSFYGQFVITALIFDFSNILEGFLSLRVFEL